MDSSSPFGQWLTPSHNKMSLMQNDPKKFYFQIIRFNHWSQEYIKWAMYLPFEQNVYLFDLFRSSKSVLPQ
jgi:hypothetical protein